MVIGRLPSTWTEKDSIKEAAQRSFDSGPSKDVIGAPHREAGGYSSGTDESTPVFQGLAAFAAVDRTYLFGRSSSAPLRHVAAFAYHGVGPLYG